MAYEVACEWIAHRDVDPAEYPAGVIHGFLNPDKTPGIPKSEIRVCVACAFALMTFGVFRPSEEVRCQSDIHLRPGHDPVPLANVLGMDGSGEWVTYCYACSPEREASGSFEPVAFLPGGWPT
jgi:hypothetical protein